ncbi:hypothetical protein D1007_46791 [Hordeum vulgare]|nr:hypothetical protein D1007_46791 [Hordeum vulgare]
MDDHQPDIEGVVNPEVVVNPWAVAVAVAAAPAVATGAGDGDAAHTQDKQAASKQAADDAEFLDKMRGWLMTAAMHPPLWMPRDYFAQWITGHSAPDADSSTKHDGLFVFRIRDGGLTVPLCSWR